MVKRSSIKETFLVHVIANEMKESFFFKLIYEC